MRLRIKTMIKSTRESSEKLLAILIVPSNSGTRPLHTTSTKEIFC
jgi:hypothetical protein